MNLTQLVYNFGRMFRSERQIAEPISTEPETAAQSLDLVNTLVQENNAKFSPIVLEQDISIYIIIFIYSPVEFDEFSTWIT